MKISKAPGAIFFLAIALSAHLFPSDRGGQPRIRPEDSRQGTSGPFPSADIDLAGHLFRRADIRPISVIAGVPAYIWRHGSGPTAAAMVLGYYDGLGFPDLFPGDAKIQTDLINQKIASEEHYLDYGLPIDSPPLLLPDKSELPEGDEHADNCLADYMWTSQSVYSNYYGWTWGTDVKFGMEEYVRATTSYAIIATTNRFFNIMWTAVKNEILSNRPMIFFVDTDADGEPDHFVTVIGVAEENGVAYYGCYNTWDTGIHWYPYRQNAPGVSWGVHSVNTVFVEHGVHPPANFGIQRIENSFIFFKEYINRLTWEANPENRSKIVRYRLFRKPSAEDDASFELLAEIDPDVLRYDDRWLGKDAVFLYKITSVDESGTESAPAMAGN